MSQLPLALRLQRNASFATFVSGDDGSLVAHVRAVALGTRPEFIWLAGPAGTGKTHLLAAGCREASEHGLRPMYVALGAKADPAMLGELDAIDLLALDDVHLAARDAGWERALFSVLNSRLDRGGLLIAAEVLPRDIGFDLTDLASRASLAPAYRLKPLDDEHLELAIARHALARGLEIDAAASAYLLSRVSRDLGELVAWLEHLDRVSLAEQRRITVPLLRREIDRRSGVSS